MADLIDNITIRFDSGAPSGAPFFNGHFPGNPIVPGAILLGYAANALFERGYLVASILRMKFQRPLFPDQAFEIEIKHTAEATTLIWRSDEAIIAQARVKLQSQNG